MGKIRSSKNADGSYVEFDPGTGKLEHKAGWFAWVSGITFCLFIWGLIVFAMIVGGFSGGTRMPWG